MDRSVTSAIPTPQSPLPPPVAEAPSAQLGAHLLFPSPVGPSLRPHPAELPDVSITLPHHRLRLPPVLGEELDFRQASTREVRDHCLKAILLSSKTERHASLVQLIDFDRERNQECAISLDGASSLVPIADDMLNIGSRGLLFDPSRLRTNWYHVELNSAQTATGKRKWVEDDSNSSPSFELYLRVWTFATASQLIGLVMAYMEIHGDELWGSEMIAECVALEDVQGPVRISYAGITSRSAAIRHKDDSDAARGRVGKFTSSEVLSLFLAQIPEAAAPALEIYAYKLPHGTSTLPLVGQQPVQDLERALIAVSSPSLNAARGGVHHLLASPASPSPSLLDHLTTQHSGLPELAKQLSTAISSALRVSRENGDNVPSDVAVAAIVEDGTAIAAVVHTSDVCVVPSMVLTSDIPEYAHQATSADVSFHGACTGPGPHALATARALTMGVRIDDGGRERWFGPRVDLWQHITKQLGQPWRHLAFLARYITTLRPVLVRAYSSDVTRYIFNSALTDIFAVNKEKDDAILERATLAFLSPDFKGSLEDVAAVISPEYRHTTHLPQTNKFIDKVGIPVVVQVGPKSENFWVICVCNIDAGAIKYNPAAERQKKELLLAVEMVSRVAEEVVIAQIKKCGPPPKANNLEWIMSTFEAMKLALEQGGTKQRLDTAARRYRELVGVLTSLSTVKTNSERMDHEDDEAWAETLASRSARMSQLRTLANGKLLSGQGEPYTSERDEQVDEILEMIGHARATGMDAHIPHGLPIFARHTDAEAREWLRSRPMGYNFSLAAQASNNHPTLGQSAEFLNDYALARFGESNDARRAKAWRCAVDENGQRLEHAATSRSLLLLFCPTCSSSAVVTVENGEHHCPMTTPPFERVHKDTLQAKRVIFGHDAYEAALKCQQIAPDVDLAPHGLAWVSAASVLQAAPSTIPKDFIAKLLSPATKEDNILVHTSTTEWQTVAAAMSRLLGHWNSPMDSHLPDHDNVSFFKNQTLKSILKLLLKDKPIYLMRCADCDYYNLRVTTDQHTCPPNTATPRPYLKRSGIPAYCFDELPHTVKSLVVYSYCRAMETGDKECGLTGDELAKCLQWEIPRPS